ncbi:DoxX family protein [Amycolatopsis sp. NPDC059657]|uniref:DoxX family protein n=1 Tax=Amycolatopsis sp. NPDC059657 TaxID=3346899 RepID=UPI00367171D1
MDTGLLVLRVVIGLVLAGHGAQKVTYLFGGEGLAGGTEEFRRDGFRGGVLTALAAGAGQIGGGLLLAAGLLTPLAAAALAGTMTVAAGVKWHKGFWVQNDGIEFPFVLIVIAASLALTGPGSWSADAVLGIAWPGWAGPAAIAAGLAAGLGARVVLHTRGELK